MKKFNLLKFSLAMTLLAGPIVASAQSDMFHGDPNNFYSQYVGAGRVLVTSPSTAAKALNYTISNDGGATDWGGPIPSNNSMIDIELVQAAPYDVCAAITNASALSGKIALVQRGNCEFGAKAFAVQTAGAVACVIVNNIDGGPVGMGAGAQGASVTIPVIMISKDDGAALVAALSSATVKMSLTKWGNGFIHDLGIVDRGGAAWHNFAIPIGQVSDAASRSKDAYKGISGAVIANFGSSNETNVKLDASISWTPNGGSASVIKTHSITRPSFGVGDSIITPFVDELYELAAATGPGKYEITYTLSMSGTDDYPNDNVAKYTFYVTPNTLSKGRYDFVNNKPILNAFFGLTTASDYLIGNLHYLAKGSYQFQGLQVAISTGDANNNSLQNVAPLNVWLFKWSDGKSTTKDGVIQADETEIVGVATRTFVAGDTSGQIFTLPIEDPNDKFKKVLSADDSWYWVAAEVPSGVFIGCDGETNLQPRAYFRDKATSTFTERYTAFIGANLATFTGTGSNEPNMYPFERGENSVDSSRFAEQRKGVIPGLPIFMSPFTVSVNETVASKSMDINLYPNPATDVVNVSVSFEKQMNKVYYSVVDGLGKSVKKATHENVTKDNYSFSVSDLAAGTYYVAINADNKVSVQKFTIVK